MSVTLNGYQKIYVISHSGTFTCTGSDWELDEFDFKCYKTISGSPSDGRTRCRTEDPNAILMLAPTIAAATHLDSLL